MHQAAEVTFQRPRLPLTVRAANYVCDQADRIGLRAARLSAGALLAAASRTTGLDDFGDPAFRAPLATLVESLDRDAGLHLVGRQLIRRRLTQILARRLYIQRDWTRWPEIAAVALGRPLVVVGLPRSGTTLLQSLLLQIPGCRFLRPWESLEPWPGTPESWSAAADPRIAQRRAQVATSRRVLPHLEGMHSFDAPLECNDLFMASLVSTRFCFEYHVPGYHRLLDGLGGGDWRAVYGDYRRQLQRLAWWQPGDPWVLKSPHHMHHLDTLLAVLPDACVVQLHRDPQKVVASMSSLATSLRLLHSNRVEPRQVGEFVLGQLTAAAERCLAARPGLDPARFLDLGYAELVRDPLGCVRRIHAHFGRPFEPAVEAAMAAWLAEHPQHKGGVHRYRLADFGLAPERVDTAFAAYRAAFEIPREAAA